MDSKNAKKTYKWGMAAAIACAILWGILPIYWQSLRPISSMVIIFYRIFLVGAVTFALGIAVYGKEKLFAPMKDRGQVLRFFVAGLLITGNWSLYIAAVNANFVIQTCIGYYIEPLMVCIFGVIFFKEKLNRYKILALGFAGLGVMVILLHFRQVPMIALGLAITFALYAAIKKKYQIEALISLFYETVFLMPPALALIIYYETKGMGAISVAQPYQLVLLSLAGILTAIPLGLFAMAANRVPLISLGITEYLAPSLALVLGIFLFKEPFDKIQLIAFSIIWVGLIVFTYGEIKEAGKTEFK